LTTWVMRGVGLTADTRVGEGTVELISTKPLLIRPVTPRFFVVGDTAMLSANVSNQTGGVLEVQVGLATRGLTITGQLTQTVQVPANGETSVSWPALAQDVTSADLVFTAVSGQYGDASRPRLATGPQGTLPVYRYSAPEVVGTGGQLQAGGSQTEAIGLPPNVDPRNGELTVRLDPSLAAGMRDGLDYLEHFDYECTEQTVSRFLPNVLTARSLKKLGIANAELEARLPGLVDEGLNKIYNQQHQDGGWGWWVDSQSNPHISAYVVFGLVRAKENGFNVRDDVLARGVDYLGAQLVAPGRKPSDWNLVDANQQAWLLYALGEAGRADKARIDDLYGSREKLGVYARAFLAMAMQKAGAQTGDAKLKTLLSDLNSAAILSATGAHWEEDARDWWSMNTDTRSTAIVLDALVRLDPANQLNPNVVRWLMVARKDGIWETTQESAWALMALTDWMDYTGELKADYDYGVWLNNQEQTSGHIGQADVEKPIVLKIKVADLLKETGNQLTIGRGAGNGRLYYTAHLRTFLPVEQIEALDRGISVRRRYVLASCQDGPKCPEVVQIKLGEVIRVELEIVAPHDLYYVQVEDPLPAGAEAIDTSLATTSLLAPDPGLQRPVPSPVLMDAPVAAPAASARPVDIYWGWWHWYSRSELRDEKVALFADYLPRGSYLYSYTMRATLPGEFHVIPTTASELYFPEVYGRADGLLLRVIAK
ncbi:MAG TPA: alpha-2-macroglobulin family protein, partial [Roseiflexaceae bacterium]|nr:alpha-2-macroglobulin family protein [Roseiflexaceae bacterium]